LIGAGALITEGKIIPDNSLVVGAPGKVVRSLTEAEIEGLLTSAIGYQTNMRRFAKGLEAISEG
jgi:carbonic anhydrase/acetyltransferase-like protein (isoleucine patch superfamily)